MGPDRMGSGRLWRRAGACRTFLVSIKGCNQHASSQPGHTAMSTGPSSPVLSSELHAELPPAVERQGQTYSQVQLGMPL